VQVRAIAFWLPKLGNAEHDWEDGCAIRLPRVAVADGATLGVGSSRWAEELVTGYVGREDCDTAPPAPDGMEPWLAATQDRWRAGNAARATSDLARIKLARDGAFATFLGVEVHGLHGGGAPEWHG